MKFYFLEKYWSSTKAASLISLLPGYLDAFDVCPFDKGFPKLKDFKVFNSKSQLSESNQCFFKIKCNHQTKKVVDLCKFHDAINSPHRVENGSSFKAAQDPWPWINSYAKFQGQVLSFKASNLWIFSVDSPET